MTLPINSHIIFTPQRQWRKKERQFGAVFLSTDHDGDEDKDGNELMSRSRYFNARGNSRDSSWIQTPSVSDCLAGTKSLSGSAETSRSDRV